MTVPMPTLRELFGSRLQENVRMSNYTTARVGGVVDGLLPLNTLEEMRTAAEKLWELQVPFRVLGSGSNILVSDRGYRGVMLLNHCHNIRIRSNEEPPVVVAESGVNLGNLARQTALRGLTGLEWANSIPGSVGGAVYGNAGAHGSDVHATLISARGLTPEGGEQELDPQGMGYEYRSSKFKREKLPVVILSAVFRTSRSTREAAWKILSDFTEKRQATQPAGPSCGSTFKNPAGDYAGRLLEAVGLKGVRIGGAAFSDLHANFIVNQGGATASDYYQLIRLAQKKVKDQFGVTLDTEIELLGEFDD